MGDGLRKGGSPAAAEGVAHGMTGDQEMDGKVVAGIPVILAEDDRWDAVWPGHDAAIRQAVQLVHDRLPASLTGSVNVVLGNDAMVRPLNRDYRGKDRPTNVLSFPSDIVGEDGMVDHGDVILALETIRDEAATQQKPFSHHAVHLVVHGVLHLLGYDHDTEDDAAAMEGLETALLAQLGIPDPYLQDRTCLGPS